MSEIAGVMTQSAWALTDIAGTYGLIKFFLELVDALQV